MGSSAPPPASIDLVDSFARRRGGEVELVLWNPSKAKDATSAELAQRQARVPGTVELVEDDRGARLVVRARRSELADGQWSITVASSGDDRYRVEARLLVQGERPLVLLWGGRRTPTEVPRTKRVPAQRRAASSGGRLLDAALRPLPTDRAVAVRGTIRRTARKLLG